MPSQFMAHAYTRRLNHSLWRMNTQEDLITVMAHEYTRRLNHSLWRMNTQEDLITVYGALIHKKT